MFEIVDSVGMRFSILNAVCMRTTYDQARIVREFSNMAGRVEPAGLSLFVFDRGTHNRGAFGSTLAKNGVAIRPAGLAAPEQIGRVERRDAMLKKMMSKVIKDTHASGRESMDMILIECLNAANEMTRHGGFLLLYNGYSHAFHAILPPWVKSPDVGAQHMLTDQQPSMCRLVTERRHVKRSYDRDCGEQVRRVALHKATLVVGSYQVGDCSTCR